MKIALIQQKATLSREANISRGLAALQEAAQKGAELVVFPELSFLPFFPQKPDDPAAISLAEPIPGPTSDLIAAKAKEFGVVVIFNLYERFGNQTYDSSPLIDADGSIRGVVRMMHIVEEPGFHEKGYYHPGNNFQLVFATKVGRVGIAICYDRHFPEYMRSLALQGAAIVVVPQAGAVDEWPANIFEAELQVAAFQNGYFAALANRVGQEEVVNFAGESFVVDPFGQVIARAPAHEEAILITDCDLRLISESPAKRHFLPDRRPEIYRNERFLISDDQ
jgi:beta-ureidopropionase